MRPVRGFTRLLRSAASQLGKDGGQWLAFAESLPAHIIQVLLGEWQWQAHQGQIEPGREWTLWLIQAGRGFGKTRAGAEWVSQRAREDRNARIALVGGTREEVARVMVEGPSGLLAIGKPGEKLKWVAKRGELRFPSGATAFAYSAEAPESLRGPQHHFAWADELAKWPKRGGDAAWDNLMMGLRMGDRPRVVVTTTPRSGTLLKRVRGLPDMVETGGRTVDNAHLPAPFIDWMVATYGGTRLGAQELEGRLIEAVEGSLFPPAMLEAARVPPFAFQEPGELKRVVVGVDPPASATGDACGIVVCGLMGGEPPSWVVLADASVRGKSPDGWARIVARVANEWGAERVVAEKNNGGEMVGTVLRGADCTLPVRLVHASRGKAARAEPVAALMEAGRIKLAGRFPELEEELSGLTAGGEYEGPSRSPDRADACVWAMSALIEGARRGEVRVLSL